MTPREFLSATHILINILFGALIILFVYLSIYSYVNPEQKTVYQTEEACSICPGFSTTETTKLDYTQVHVLSAVTITLLVGWISYYIVIRLVSKSGRSKRKH